MVLIALVWTCSQLVFKSKAKSKNRISYKRVDWFFSWGPPDFIIGPLIFNIFIDDLSMFVEKAKQIYPKPVGSTELFRA